MVSSPMSTPLSDEEAKSLGLHDAISDEQADSLGLTGRKAEGHEPKSAQAPTQETSSGQAIASGLGRGLTFGLGDKLAAAGMAGKMALDGSPIGFGENYSQIRNTQDRLHSRADEEHPWLTVLGKFAGGMATAAVAPAVRVGQGLIGAMATGGINSSIYRGIDNALSGHTSVNDFTGAKQLQSAVDNLHQGDYGQAALNVSGAGLPGAFIGGSVAGAGAHGLGKTVDSGKGAVQRWLANKMNSARSETIDAADIAAKSKAVTSETPAPTVNKAKMVPKGASSEPAPDIADAPGTGDLESVQIRQGRQAGRKAAAINQAALLEQHGIPGTPEQVAARHAILGDRSVPGLKSPSSAQANVMREASGPPTQILSPEDSMAAGGASPGESPASGLTSNEVSTNPGRPGRTGKPPTDPRFNNYSHLDDIEVPTGPNEGLMNRYVGGAEKAGSEFTPAAGMEENHGIKLLPGEDIALRAQFQGLNPKATPLMQGVPGAAAKYGASMAGPGYYMGHTLKAVAGGAMTGAAKQTASNALSPVNRALVSRYLLERSASLGQVSSSLPDIAGYATGAASGGKKDPRQP